MWALQVSLNNVCQGSMKGKNREVRTQHLISVWKSLIYLLIIKLGNRRNLPSQDNLVHTDLVTNDYSCIICFLFSLTPSWILTINPNGAKVVEKINFE